MDYRKSEKWLEKQLQIRVKAAGGIALKYTSQTVTGYPDRLVLMPGGLTYWCELKSTGNKPRRVQEIRIEELRKLGQTVFVVDSPEELDRMMHKIGYDTEVQGCCCMVRSFRTVDEI